MTHKPIYFFFLDPFFFSSSLEFLCKNVNIQSDKKICWILDCLIVMKLEIIRIVSECNSVNEVNFSLCLFDFNPLKTI